MDDDILRDPDTGLHQPYGAEDRHRHPKIRRSEPSETGLAVSHPAAVTSTPAADTVAET